MRRAARRRVLSQLKTRWGEFKRYPPGKRFQTVHERQANAPAWVKALLIAAAVIAFAIGVLLSVLPGPAFVFYGIAGALAAVESAWAARLLDHAELKARALLKRFRRRHSQRREATKRKHSAGA